MHDRAEGTADHIFPQGDWLDGSSLFARVCPEVGESVGRSVGNAKISGFSLDFFISLRRRASEANNCCSNEGQKRNMNLSKTE